MLQMWSYSLLEKGFSPLYLSVDGAARIAGLRESDAHGQANPFITAALGDAQSLAVGGDNPT